MTGCQVETTFQGLRFACRYRRHDGPHAFWLAEPSDRVWTAATLLEDTADDPELRFWPTRKTNG